MSKIMLNGVQIGGDQAASSVSFDNTDTDLSAANVQDAVEEVNGKLNIRYNAETDKVQIYYNDGWHDWKFGNMQSIDLYLTSRTLGEPDNTNMSNNNNRTFSLNSYVIGISLNNYYYQKNCTATIDSTGKISVKSNGGGYGIGIPMLLTAGKTYRMSGDITGVGSVGTMYFASSGAYGSANGNEKTGDMFEHEFTVPSGYPVVLLHFQSNVSTGTTFIVSNLSLKEV